MATNYKHMMIYFYHREVQNIAQKNLIFVKLEYLMYFCRVKLRQYPPMLMDAGISTCLSVCYIDMLSKNIDIVGW